MARQTGVEEMREREGERQMRPCIRKKKQEKDNPAIVLPDAFTLSARAIFLAAIYLPRVPNKMLPFRSGYGVGQVRPIIPGPAINAETL